MATNSYSFLDFQCALIGPGGIITLGSGSGNSEEGIKFEPIEDVDKMSIGADGTPMHTLIANKGGKIIVSLQKTSPVNQKLSLMLNFQRSSSANWGQNIITGRDAVRGDVYTCQKTAFTKVPANAFSKEAGMIDWEFNVGIMDFSLGSGT